MSRRLAKNTFFNHMTGEFAPAFAFRRSTIFYSPPVVSTAGSTFTISHRVKKLKRLISTPIILKTPAPTSKWRSLRGKWWPPFRSARTGAPFVSVLTSAGWLFIIWKMWKGAKCKFNFPRASPFPQFNFKGQSKLKLLKALLQWGHLITLWANWMSPSKMIAERGPIEGKSYSRSRKFLNLQVGWKCPLHKSRDKLSQLKFFHNRNKMAMFKRISRWSWMSWRLRLHRWSIGIHLKSPLKTKMSLNQWKSIKWRKLPLKSF